MSGEAEEDRQYLSNCKNLYWVQMPATINDDFRIELLKRDIFVHRIFARDFSEFSFDELPPDADGLSIYFFNLDDILGNEVTRVKDRLYLACKSLAQKINDFIPHKCVVHSNLIDNKVKEIFNNEKVIHLQKNLHSHRLALSTILNLAPIILGDQGREKRAAIRISTYPEMKIKAQGKKLVALKDQSEFAFSGTVKDISLNGFCLIVEDEMTFKALALKEPISLKVNLPRAILRIQTAFIVRLDADKKEIGLSFKLLNHKMVSEDNATVLSTFVFGHLKTLVKKE